jgi:hypothetical protein
MPSKGPLGVHLNLSFLGPEHQSKSYVLKMGGRRHQLERHTPESLRSHGLLAVEAAKQPTHFAVAAAPSTKNLELIRVYGPPTKEGFPTLAMVAVVLPGSSKTYDQSDLAKALTFMHPQVSVLTPESASTVLGHIDRTSAVLQLQMDLQTIGANWNTAKPLLDEAGKPILDGKGNPRYTYELQPGILADLSACATESKTAIYSDESLKGVRWNLQNGVSTIQVQQPASGLRAHAGSSSGGYHYDLKDGGPFYGVSARVKSLTNDFVLDIEITNSFIRHLGLFASFLAPDNKTALKLPDPEWLKLVKEATYDVVSVFYEMINEFPDLRQILGNSDFTLQFLDTVSAESTFLGVPVAQADSHLTFQLPVNSGPIGTVRILAGSLGVPSGNEFDPLAAWLGIAMTAFLDLVLPTASMIATVGEESNELFDSIFKDWKFLLPTAYAIYTVAKDIIDGSENTGNDISAALAALADRIVGKVLTAPDVAAKLAAVFGAEEAEESIPIAGWALKVLALEGTAMQLAQTIGEVIGSPRVVEFDLTVTMDATITLVPDQTQKEPGFASTATAYTITAQYSDTTTRTFHGSIADPKVAELKAAWSGIPVGGSVAFVVALYSAEGHLVGKGQSASIPNLLTPGHEELIVTIPITELLYPLTSKTTYKHSQLLSYSGGYYNWHATNQAPTETAYNLGTGANGHVLESLVSLSISSDLSILGYAWQAAGLSIPPVTGDETNVELYAFKNIAFGPNPNAGVMDTPAGYNEPPQLVYLRTAEQSSLGAATFFLDPSGDSTTGFHLRRITPVTDPSVSANSPKRQFDLAKSTSWGRFNFMPTSLALHPNGYVVAVNPAYPTMQVLRLPADGVPDAKAPWATLPLGPGTRAGLVNAPALVTVTPNGTVLILESGNTRIQAFSWGGHPVPAFAGSATPYWIPMVQHDSAGEGVTYLAISTDVAGYVFVLSQLGNGYKAEQFWLDVYTPTGTVLFSQQGLAAASLVVDLWRNLYTLNFQQILGPNDRTEPSVSEYIPSTPANI